MGVLSRGESTTTPHADRRLEQRYGVYPDRHIADGIISKIRCTGKRPLRVCKKPGKEKRFIFQVRRGRNKYVVVTDKKIEKIITFLPLEAKETIKKT